MDIKNIWGSEGKEPLRLQDIGLPKNPCDRSGRHCTVGALSAGDRWFSKEDRKAGKLIGCDIRGGIRADCVRCYGAI